MRSWRNGRGGKSFPTRAPGRRPEPLPLPVRPGEGRGPDHGFRRPGWRTGPADQTGGVFHLDPGLRRGARRKDCDRCRRNFSVRHRNPALFSEGGTAPFYPRPGPRLTYDAGSRFAERTTTRDFRPFRLFRLCFFVRTDRQNPTPHPVILGLDPRIGRSSAHPEGPAHVRNFAVSRADNPILGSSPRMTTFHDQATSNPDSHTTSAIAAYPAAFGCRPSSLNPCRINPSSPTSAA